MARPKKNINVKKIAEEAGVSQMTVSRVLNNRAGVSEEVRTKIIKLQKKYNYRTVYPTKYKVKIAIAVSSQGIGDYYRRTLAGVQDYITDRNLEVTLLMCANHNEDLLQKIRETQCSALIMPVAHKFSSMYEAIAATNLPVMLLDNWQEIPGMGSITNDSYSGSCLAAEHLLTAGHTKIGYISYGTNDGGDHHLRLQGYTDTVASHGITVPAHWIQAGNELYLKQGVPYWESVSRSLDLLLERAPELTAIMTVDDNLALIIMQRLMQKGLRIPQDISVIGFDNHTDSKYWFPALTTVNHPLEASGYQAAQALEQALNNPGNWALPRKMLPTSLIIRDSVCQPRK